MSAEATGDVSVYRATGRTKAKALSDKTRDAMLRLAKERAPDPSVFDEVEPFFFTVSASNRKVDSYFTTMDETSLQNYAQDANDPGVQFQNSHSTKSVGFGRSLSGEVIGRGQNQEVLIDFYAIPGLRAEGTTSDEFILGSRAGIYNDVSIGFMPGKMICNICGNDFLRKWEVEWGSPEQCQHWPGMNYKTEDARGKQKETTCILNVMEGRLNEVSFVYDGATPGAGIVAVDMARMISAEGRLLDSDRTALENIYRVRIAPPDGVYAVATEIKPGRAVVVDTTQNTEAQVAAVVGEDDTVIAFDEEATTEERQLAPLERLREKYKGTPIRIGNDPYKAVESLADVVLEQQKRIKTMERDAEDGKQFREGLLEEMDASVVRAYGAAVAEEKQKARHRSLMAGQSVDTIRETIADLEERSRFKAGRQTAEVTEDDGKDDDAAPENVTPLNANRRTTRPL